MMRSGRRRNFAASPWVNRVLFVLVVALSIFLLMSRRSKVATEPTTTTTATTTRPMKTTAAVSGVSKDVAVPTRSDLQGSNGTRAKPAQSKQKPTLAERRKHCEALHHAAMASMVFGDDNDLAAPNDAVPYWTFAVPFIQQMASSTSQMVVGFTGLPPSDLRLVTSLYLQLSGSSLEDALPPKDIDASSKRRDPNTPNVKVVLHEATLSPTSIHVLKLINKCHDSRKATAHAATSDLLSNQHADLLVVGSVARALEVLAVKPPIASRWVLVFDPFASTTEWTTFMTIVSTTVRRETSWEGIGTLVSIGPRMALLQNERFESISLPIKGISKRYQAFVQKMKEAKLRSPKFRGAIVGEAQMGKERAFFMRGHEAYYDFVDEGGLLDRYNDDKMVAQRYFDAVEQRIRMGITVQRHTIDTAALRKKHGETLTDEELAVVEAAKKKLEELSADKRELPQLLEKSTELRNHAFQEQFAVIKQRQRQGGDLGDIADDGNVADFAKILTANKEDFGTCEALLKATQMSHLCSAPSRHRPPTAKHGLQSDDEPKMRSSGAGRLQQDDGLFHAKSIWMLRALIADDAPTSPFAGWLTALFGYGSVVTRPTVTVLDCHPQLIAIATSIILARRNKMMPLPGQVTIANGDVCGVGFFRNLFPNLHSAIKTTGPALPLRRSDVVMTFYNALERTEHIDQLLADTFLVVFGTGVEQVDSRVAVNSTWRQLYTSKQGIGMTIWTTLPRTQLEL